MAPSGRYRETRKDQDTPSILSGSGYHILYNQTHYNQTCLWLSLDPSLMTE